ncbi:hypothetical protein Patl1_15943 [Pistacia atlantica]|uniref:Uncharacterized protein n=1 Tax=Pistacia atlantica TaxID=434234 RepID=A0ACC1B6U3_9ROSI|nr:hypothetical protein Patl1_15943 [Pistacia atlantica]
MQQPLHTQAQHCRESLPPREVGEKMRQQQLATLRVCMPVHGSIPNRTKWIQSSSIFDPPLDPPISSPELRRTPNQTSFLPSPSL